MRALHGRFREQDAVVGDDADRDTVDAGKARHQRGAVIRLELVELRAVDDAGDDLADIVLLLEIDRHDRVEIARVDRRRANGGERQVRRLGAVEIGDDTAGLRQGLIVVDRIVIGNAGNAGMDLGTAEILGRNLLARRRLDQWRTGQEDRPLLPHDDGFVRHCRHIGTAGGARAHHHRDLRNAHGRHVGLVEEDPAEMIAVWENLGLVRQVGAAGIDEVDAGKAGFSIAIFLRPQMLAHGHRIVGAALDGGVVAHDHAIAARHPADAGDKSGAVDGVVIETMGGKRADLQERAAGIEQTGDALARE